MVKVHNGSWLNCLRSKELISNCQVRAMTATDLPMVLEWRNHPNVRRFMFTQHEITFQEHARWFVQASQDQTRRLLIIEENGHAIGYVQFTNLGPEGISDWGFYARPDSPKGTGKKLGIAALDHGFRILKLHKVCGQAIERNTNSIRFHERLGFTREAELRDQKFINNQYENLICFGLLAHEWKAQANGEIQ